MSTEKEKHDKFIKTVPKKFQKEISDGLKFINKHKGIRATVFGSHRVVEGDYFYLCNQAVKANWQKTDISTKRVDCKNCLRILNRLRIHNA